MTTTYTVYAVAAKLHSDRSVSTNPADYQAPVGMNTLLDNRHIPPARKPPASYHRSANRLRNWLHKGEDALVLLYCRYDLAQRGFIITDVHKVDEAQRCR